MTVHPVASSQPVLESDSSVFFKVATILLGLAVPIVLFFALMLWADARDEHQAAAAQPAAQADAAGHNTALPLNSFAGIVPPNAQALAGRQVQHLGIRRPWRSGPDHQCARGPDGRDDVDERRLDPALD
jgi:hypothetical protein